MKVEVTNQQPQIAAAVKVTATSMDKMVEAMDTGYGKLMGYIAEQGTPGSGAQIAGAPYCAYMNPSDEEWTLFDMELGIPIAEPVSASDGIYMSQTYEGKAVTATHKGAYKDVGQAYTAIIDYAKKNSIELTDFMYDYYLNNPDDTPESELLTLVVYPIK